MNCGRFWHTNPQPHAAQDQPEERGILPQDHFHEGGKRDVDGHPQETYSAHQEKDDLEVAILLNVVAVTVISGAVISMLVSLALGFVTDIL